MREDTWEWPSSYESWVALQDLRTHKCSQPSYAVENEIAFTPFQMPNYVPQHTHTCSVLKGGSEILPIVWQSKFISWKPETTLSYKLTLFLLYFEDEVGGKEVYARKSILKTELCFNCAFHFPSWIVKLGHICTATVCVCSWTLRHEEEENEASPWKMQAPFPWSIPLLKANHTWYTACTDPILKSPLPALQTA